MLKKSCFIIGLISLFLFSCEQKDGLYAQIQTNKGTILLQLEFEKTPLTVANFITLAEGTNSRVENKFKNKAFYNGLKFHCVIPGEILKGGDPNGNGTGGPGYSFKDEFNKYLKFDKAGKIAMTNNGIGTNGSQFFITLNNNIKGRNTIFGQVIKGQENANNIAVNDQIKFVKIIRKGNKANSFDAKKIVEDYFKNFDEKAQFFSKMKDKAKKTNSGLKYIITRKGGASKPKLGTTYYVSYSGFFENGILFDSNNKKICKEYGKYDPSKERQDIYTPFPFQEGKKMGLITGFIEGLEKMSFGDKAIIFIPSHLGYGIQGAGTIIPPNTNLVFELEKLEKLPN